MGNDNKTNNMVFKLKAYAVIANLFSMGNSVSFYS